MRPGAFAASTSLLAVLLLAAGFAFYELGRRRRELADLPVRSVAEPT